MLSWPVVRGIVPSNSSAKSISSGPRLTLAASTASRSEPTPLSARFRTVKVVGKARPSSNSTRGTKRCREDRGLLVERRNQVDNMRQPPRSAVERRSIAAGAQTERRGGAGLAGGLLGGKDPPAASLSRSTGRG